MFQALLTQLIHDLRVSWKKTALLGALLLAFLFFCLPPVLEAVRGGPSRKPKSTKSARKTPVRTVEAETTFQTQTSTSAPAPSDTFGWDQVEELLMTDPLVKSVEVAAIQRDPFHINRDQFPPPIEFEKDPDTEDTQQDIAAELTNGSEDTAESEAPTGMVLKSTMIGVKRRAAFINTDFDGRPIGRLYFEGREVLGVDGEPYILSAIYPRKVILTRELDVYELRLAGEQTSGTIEMRTNGQTDP